MAARHDDIFVLLGRSLEADGAVEPDRTGKPTGIGEPVQGALRACRPVPSHERAALRALALGPPERRLWCRWYWRCIDHAITHRWGGFSCGVCPIQDELSLEEKAKVYEGMGRALKARLRDVS